MRLSKNIILIFSSEYDAVTKNVVNYIKSLSQFQVIRIDDIEKKQENIEKYCTFYLQQYIDKLYGIRIFYLYGNFYSKAIFSQGNSKTRIDFRNYDSERPNSCLQRLRVSLHLHRLPHLQRRP